MFENSLRSIASRVGIDTVENEFPTDFWTECLSRGFLTWNTWTGAWRRFFAEVDGADADGPAYSTAFGSTTAVFSFEANITWSVSSILKQ